MPLSFLRLVERAVKSDAVHWRLYNKRPELASDNTVSVDLAAFSNCPGRHTSYAMDVGGYGMLVPTDTDLAFLFASGILLLRGLCECLLDTSGETYQYSRQ
jgi:hypothetical protein